MEVTATTLRVFATAAIGLALVVTTRMPAMAQSDDLDALIGEDAEASGPASNASAEPGPATGGEAAQEPSARSRRVLEEIIVTAQKREERLEDVPLSISVVDDEFLNQESLTDLFELSRHIPNVKVLSTAFSPRANIRGFGVDEVSGGNKSVESPVGVSIDGVSYGNKHYLQSGFFDMDRIEVLRGPQNTLFGKNNSVGLFNISTRNPTDEYTGYVDTEIGEFGRRRFEGGVGGPILPGFLNFRIAGLSEDRDGFKNNTTARIVSAAQDPLVTLDRKAIRVKAAFPDLFGANVVLSYERFSVAVNGIGLEFAIVPEGTRDFYREFDPDTDFVYGNNTLSTDFPSQVRLDFDTFVANASYPLGDWGLDAVVGYSVLKLDNQVDPDTGPIPMIFSFASDKNPQTTFELRTTSPDFAGLFGLESLFGRALGSTDFTAGLFFQRRQVLDSEFTAAFDSSLIGAMAVLGGMPPPDGAPVPPPVITREAVGSTIESTTMFWEETSHTVAGYGQARWHFAERWTLLGGLRLGNEWKSAEWNRVLEGSPPVFLSFAGFEEFTHQQSRTEFQWAPQVNLRYDVLDDASVYAGWARGFRGGGLNEFAQQPVNLEFEPEESLDWQVGGNAYFLAGTARASLTLFHTTITDFQLVTQLPGGGLIEITKAGKARSMGAEAEGMWLPTDWLTIRATQAFIDAEFIDFPFGPCTGDNPNPEGDDEPRCDHSGKPIPRAPRWATTVTPGVRFPLSRVPVLGSAVTLARSMNLIGSVTFEYQDSQYLDLVLDRRTREESSIRFDGNIGFENVDQGWSIRLTMVNLTDELVTDTAREVTLAPGHYVRSAAEPRTVFGELRWSF